MAKLSRYLVGNLPQHCSMDALSAAGHATHAAATLLEAPIEE